MEIKRKLSEYSELVLNNKMISYKIKPRIREQLDQNNAFVIIFILTSVTYIVFVSLDIENVSVPLLKALSIFYPRLLYILSYHWLCERCQFFRVM